MSTEALDGGVFYMMGPRMEPIDALCAAFIERMFHVKFGAKNGSEMYESLGSPNLCIIPGHSFTSDSLSWKIK